jgi:hypothetical protein
VGGAAAGKGWCPSRDYQRAITNFRIARDQHTVSGQKRRARSNPKATSTGCRQIVKVDGIQERLYRISVQVTINDGRWRYKQPFADGSKPVQYGLIAEEVAEVYPDLVAHSTDGQIVTVKYQVLD